MMDDRVGVGQASTGASNDLAAATAIARKMATEYGLSPALGPVSFEQSGQMPTDVGARLDSSRCADDTQRAIDVEVERFLRDAEQRALDILTENRAQLDAMVGLLLVDETIDGQAVYRIVGRPCPGARPQVLTLSRHAASRPSAD